MLLCPDWVFGQRANAEIRVLGGFTKTCQNFAFYQVDLTLHVNAFCVVGGFPKTCQNIAFCQVYLTLHVNAYNHEAVSCYVTGEGRTEEICCTDARTSRIPNKGHIPSKIKQCGT